MMREVTGLFRFFANCPLSPKPGAVTRILSGTAAAEAEAVDSGRRRR